MLCSHIFSRECSITLLYLVICKMCFSHHENFFRSNKTSLFLLEFKRVLAYTALNFIGHVLRGYLIPNCSNKWTGKKMWHLLLTSSMGLPPNMAENVIVKLFRSLNVHFLRKAGCTMLDFLSAGESSSHNTLLCKFRTEFSFSAITFKHTMDSSLSSCRGLATKSRQWQSPPPSQVGS